MISRDRYVELVAELINQDPDSRERSRRVREANRVLYQETVSRRASIAQADLALAQSAERGKK